MLMETIGSSTAGGTPLGLWFAREPDTEFELEELDAPDRERRGTAGAPGKPPRSNTIALLILLLVVAVGAYFAMNPEFVMNLLGQESVPGDAPAPVQPAPGTVTPSGVQRAGSDAVEKQAALPPGMVPSPLFGEGQHVSVNGAPASPASPIVLSVDSAGAEAGHTVRPGEVVTVVDAEWLGNRWVYLVRTQDAKGWIAETQLTAAP